MRSRTKHWPLAVAAFLVACWMAPVVANASDTLEVSNTGIAIEEHGNVRAGGSAFLVSEQGHGNQDLNGDGDTEDLVLHRYHPDTGVANLGLATGSRFWGDGVDSLLAFSVGENYVDLNSDGDSEDSVIHVHDADLGVVNLGLAVNTGETSFSVAGDRVAFGVSEAKQGYADLNGDGDVEFWDFVLHVFGPKTGPVNLGYAIGPIVLIDSGVVFGVSEYSHGASDLNGDGDTEDVVAHTLIEGVVTNLGVAAETYQVFNDLVFVEVYEDAQGKSDLNGDGDTYDSVLHVFTPTDGLINLEVVASIALPCEGAFTFSVSEWQSGQVDLNGDGDTSDGVLHRLDPPSTITNLGIAGSPPGQYEGGCAFTVSEEEANADLNGDGDTLDRVAHTYENGEIENLGIACTWGFSHPQIGVWSWLNAVGSGFGCNVDEEDQGDTDLNGDGDTNDHVGHVYYVGEGVTNLGVGSAWTNYLELGDGFAMTVAEWEEGADLNGDGLVAGPIVHYYDHATGTLHNLGVPGEQLSSVSSSQLIWPVAEYLSGPVDLNGDGDTADEVVHTLTVAGADVITRLVAMQDDLAALADAGELDDRSASSLISTLDRAIGYVEGGAIQNACALLDRFSTRVEKMVRTGSIAIEYAGPLLAEADALRTELGC